MTTAPPTAALQIDLQRLTNILDAANLTWQEVLQIDDPVERLNFLRIHAKQLQQYFEALDAFLDAAPGADHRQRTPGAPHAPNAPGPVCYPSK